MITQEADGWQVPDWRRLQADLITDVAALCEHLGLDPARLPDGVDADSDFLRVPRRYLDRIEPGNPDDPLLRQVLASGRERETVPGYGADPWRRPSTRRCRGCCTSTMAAPCWWSPGPARCTAVTASAAISLPDPFVRRTLEAGPGLVTRARRHPRGDPQRRRPLTLGNERLAALLEELAAIPHLDRLRLHSRTPVVIPERLDDGLLSLLEAPRWRATLVLHANHPGKSTPIWRPAAGPWAGPGSPCSTRRCCWPASTTTRTPWRRCPTGSTTPGCCRITCTNWTRWPGPPTSPFPTIVPGPCTPLCALVCRAFWCPGWPEEPGEAAKTVLAG